MRQQNKWSHPHQIVGPGKGQQEYCSYVVDEIYPEILVYIDEQLLNRQYATVYLSLDVDKLRYDEGPVETQFKHVIPVQISGDGLNRITVGYITYSMTHKNICMYSIVPGEDNRTNNWSCSKNNLSASLKYF